MVGTGIDTLTLCNYLVNLEEVFKPVHEGQAKSCPFMCTASDRITTRMNSSVSETLEGGAYSLTALRTTEGDVVADSALEFNHR